MELDRVAVMNLFEEFLEECRQVDEPEVSQVLGMICRRFEEVDHLYKNSEVFKRFLRRVIPNIKKSPWETMKAVADDLKYHTLNNFQFVGSNHRPAENALYEESNARSCQSSDSDSRSDETTSEYSSESSILSSFSSSDGVEDSLIASGTGDGDFLLQEHNAARSCQPIDKSNIENPLEYIHSKFNISNGIENSQANCSGDHEVANNSGILTSEFSSRVMVNSVDSLPTESREKIMESLSSSEFSVNSEDRQPVESCPDEVEANSGNYSSEAGVLSQSSDGRDFGQDMMIGLNFSPFMYVRLHGMGTESSQGAEMYQKKYNRNDKYFSFVSLDTFLVENMLSEVDTGFHRSLYDEVECMNLEKLAKVRKLEKIEELKVDLSKLNLEISILGSLEITDWSDETASIIQTLGKIRSLMGKYLVVHKKICELTNTEIYQKRQTIKFTGTKSDAIDRAIEKFYNEYNNIDMPFLDEISDVIRNANDEELTESQISAKAVTVFKVLGRIRRRQRANEFDNLILSYLPMGGSSDPASVHLSLWRKLCKNEKLNQEKMDTVINDYANQEDIRMRRRTMTRRRSQILDSMVQLDLEGFMRLFVIPTQCDADDNEGVST